MTKVGKIPSNRIYQAEFVLSSQETKEAPLVELHGKVAVHVGEDVTSLSDEEVKDFLERIVKSERVQEHLQDFSHLYDVLITNVSEDEFTYICDGIQGKISFEEIQEGGPQVTITRMLQLEE